METPEFEPTDTPGLLRKKKPEAFDVSKLEQRKVDKATPRQKTRGKTRAPLYKAPPRGQQKGPITKGPASYIECTTCSRLFSTKEKPVRIAVRKRHAARHLSDHKMGRIKRPTEAKGG